MHQFATGTTHTIYFELDGKWENERDGYP